MLDRSALRAALASAPLVPPEVQRTVTYGTAGFRGSADGGRLRAVAYRCGALAVTRACAAACAHLQRAQQTPATRAAAVTGVVITASHNPGEDNGVKLVDCDGGMLDAEWEALATRLVAGPAGDGAPALADALCDILERQCGDAFCAGGGGRVAVFVVVGRDTRATSAELARCAVAGGRDALRAVRLATDGRILPQRGVYDAGVCTTPQLHHAVRALNERAHRDAALESEHVARALARYETQLVDAYAALLRATSALVARSDHSDNGATHTVTVDCANGVGAVVMRRIAPRLRAECGLGVRLINVDVDDTRRLNARCGSEYVQKERRAPIGLRGDEANNSSNDDDDDDDGTTAMHASLDGDADRLICYARHGDGQLAVLDGDRMAALIVDMLVVGTRDAPPLVPPDADVSIGVVQTAYANGASTEYLESVAERRVRVVCARTGVKHLEREAKRFDIGVYFEANGHGTVLFTERAVRALHRLPSSSSSPPSPSQRQHSERAAATAATAVTAMASLANQAVGDGIADLLLVLAALRRRQWTVRQWASPRALYADLPSVNAVVRVPERAALVTTEDADRRVRAPAALQADIDAAVARACRDSAAAAAPPPPGAPRRPRAFVRPSGTENVVRVYAEADTASAARQLADEVARAVRQHMHASAAAAAVDHDDDADADATTTTTTTTAVPHRS